MNGWNDFVWTVIASSAGTSALLTIAAVLSKNQISHWLNKDLEAVKSRHQRELETYKVSLIAEVERTKAMQEVKKAGALLVIEHKYQTLQKLHASITPLGFAIFDFIQTDKEGRVARLEKMVALSDQLDEAAGNAAFLSREDRTALRNFQAEVGRQMTYALQERPQFTGKSLEAFKLKWTSTYESIESTVSDSIQQMMEM